MSSSVQPLQCLHLILIDPFSIFSYIRKRPQPLQYTGFGSLDLRFLVILRVPKFYLPARQTPAKIPMIKIIPTTLNRRLASCVVINYSLAQSAAGQDAKLGCVQELCKPLLISDLVSIWCLLVECKM